MNYFHEIVKKAEELGLKRHDMRYINPQLRTGVWEVIFYADTKPKHEVIARVRTFSDYPHETELSLKKAFQALNDYATWK